MRLLPGLHDFTQDKLTQPFVAILPNRNAPAGLQLRDR
jgi:hypothetical protein